MFPGWWRRGSKGFWEELLCFPWDLFSSSPPYQGLAWGQSHPASPGLNWAARAGLWMGNTGGRSGNETAGTWLQEQHEQQQSRAQGHGSGVTSRFAHLVTSTHTRARGSGPLCWHQHQRNGCSAGELPTCGNRRENPP